MITQKHVDLLCWTVIVCIIALFTCCCRYILSMPEELKDVVMPMVGELERKRQDDIVYNENERIKIIKEITALTKRVDMLSQYLTYGGCRQ